jgi:hypothetical protein
MCPHRKHLNQGITLPASLVTAGSEDVHIGQGGELDTSGSAIWAVRLVRQTYESIRQISDGRRAVFGCLHDICRIAQGRRGAMLRPWRDRRFELITDHLACTKVRIELNQADTVLAVEFPNRPRPH